MSGSSTTTLPYKAFTVTNVKAHIPLILDLDRNNYNSWREIFSTHCEAYDALDHIDSTYDDPAPKPTEPEWKKVDAMVNGFEP